MTMHGVEHIKLTTCKLCNSEGTVSASRGEMLALLLRTVSYVWRPPTNTSLIEMIFYVNFRGSHVTRCLQLVTLV